MGENYSRLEAIASNLDRYFPVHHASYSYYQNKYKSDIQISVEYYQEQVNLLKDNGYNYTPKH